MDEKGAADFLGQIAQEKGPGVHDVSLPEGLKTRAFLPNGTEIPTDMARVVVKDNGAIRTVFPYNGNFSSGSGK